MCWKLISTAHPIHASGAQGYFWPCSHLVLQDNFAYKYSNSRQPEDCYSEEDSMSPPRFNTKVQSSAWRRRQCKEGSSILLPLWVLSERLGFDFHSNLLL